MPEKQQPIGIIGLGLLGGAIVMETKGDRMVRRDPHHGPRPLFRGDIRPCSCNIGRNPVGMSPRSREAAPRARP